MEIIHPTVVKGHPHKAGSAIIAFDAILFDDLARISGCAPAICEGRPRSLYAIFLADGQLVHPELGHDPACRAAARSEADDLALDQDDLA